MSGGTLEWTQLYGPPATVVSPNALVTDVTALEEGFVYLFRLSVTTADGVFADDVVVAPLAASPQSAAIDGELAQWHRVGLTFTGPSVAESDSPNPFLDSRFDVYFTQGDTTLRVPGFFAGDGDAEIGRASCRERV